MARACSGSRPVLVWIGGKGKFGLCSIVLAPRASLSPPFLSFHPRHLSATSFNQQCFRRRPPSLTHRRPSRVFDILAHLAVVVANNEALAEDKPSKAPGARPHRFFSQRNRKLIRPRPSRRAPASSPTSRSRILLLFSCRRHNTRGNIRKEKRLNC